MDINLLRAALTVLLFIAFIGIGVWAYSGKRKKQFDEAANLPFADDELGSKSPGKTDSSTTDSSKEER